MTQSVTRFQWKRVFRLSGWVVVVCSFAAAGACFMSHQQDRTRLRAVARGIIAEADSPAQRVLGLLHWVHENGGTGENESFFVWPRLRAMPLQILEAGGDCADKSRLLSALLREVEIPATAAMCFDAPSGMPTHTIVEAQPEEGVYMVVDPAYDLYFPRDDAPGYYDLLDLRRDPDLVARRVAELRTQPVPHSEAGLYYLRPSTTYAYVSTINWNKNACLRFVQRQLQRWYGDEVYRLPRPVLLEEPKLFVAAASLLPAVFSLLILGGAAYATRHRRLHSKLSRRQLAAGAVIRSVQV